MIKKGGAVSAAPPFLYFGSLVLTPESPGGNAAQTQQDKPQTDQGTGLRNVDDIILCVDSLAVLNGIPRNPIVGIIEGRRNTGKQHICFGYVRCGDTGNGIETAGAVGQIVTTCGFKHDFPNRDLSSGCRCARQILAE